MADVTGTIVPPPPQVGMGGAAIQMAVALLLILAVILLAFWMLRRFGPKFGLGPSSKPLGLRVEGHLTLGPRKNIMVVRFLNRLLVLGVTDQSINLLTEVDASDETKDFKTALEDAARRSDDPGGPGSP
ncbi:MAG: flagellar biosynthetic protein FliO [Thermodesulfobacteriota bacterium]